MSADSLRDGVCEHRLAWTRTLLVARCDRCGQRYEIGGLTSDLLRLQLAEFVRREELSRQGVLKR